ncbi:nematocyst expressed protein 6-like [Xenia sp. Carnegie-2017]|uniref:nematocyst expressed protein 6-like n=1 Tax=Xenia sp. Carnegie-2017 TaxID=2897299 RepID=UPI001F04036E|nr:nematocyst expressed protein 6-like [Xenia sp. Carnegie-2017]XP_046850754.1 nematocyst expressed protein 6-like [Xenia sp. Carnegie-2017]XP_046850755.1 nematocyst expressed protein 6-like [Xenia sp. Carnegie-2017]XP_046850756.1 nematocyst expressed protein 6-like [Xenia sp. Carnegie-2017]
MAMKSMYLFVFQLFLCSTQGWRVVNKLLLRDYENNHLPTPLNISSKASEENGAVDTFDHYLPMLDETAKLRETVAKAEENLKAHYFEGDIILTPRQQKVLHNAFKYAHKRSDAENRALIKDVSRLWPDGKVPYAYASDIDSEGKSITKDAMEHWMQHTCVKFIPQTNETDFVEFQFADACASRVGRLGMGRQEILIGSVEAKCKVGNLIHEIGHTLGFFHEHSRPDRDQFVKVNLDLVMQGFEINFKKLPGDWIDSRDVAYDYDSIMHYPRTIFGKMPWDQTVVPLDARAQIGQRIKLSDSDILQAKKLYNCPGYEQNIQT